MVFSSIPFLFFLLVLFLLIYSAVTKNIKNYVLLAFSLIFYAWGEPVYIVLMIIETFSDYLVGRVMVRADGAKRKLLLTWSLLVDLGVLGFFKYADFLAGTINSVFNTDIKKLELALPVGISFFTFQSLSYVIDLYKREIEAENSYNFYYSKLSDSDKDLYAQLYLIVDAELVDEKLITLNVDKVDQVFFALTNDHPQMYYVAG